MAKETKTIDEKSLSDNFQKISQLPAKDLTDENKAAAEALFAQIVEQVKGGHTVTFAEYIALDNFGKTYEFKAMLSKMDAKKRQGFKQFIDKIQETGTRMAEAKQQAIDAFVKDFPTKGSDKDNRPKISKRVEALNTALANTNSSFTPQQIQTLQTVIAAHGATKSKINIDTMFKNIITPEKGKSTASPAFRTLYSQISPKQPSAKDNTLANDLANRLQNTYKDYAAKEKYDQLSPAAQRVIDTVLKTESENGNKFTESDKEALYDLALSIDTPEQSPATFAKTLAVNAKDKFYREDIRIITQTALEIDEWEKQVLALTDTILNKNPEERTEGEIALLHGFARVNIAADRINDALTADAPEQQAETENKPEDNPAPATETKEPEITVTPDEVTKYMDEIRNSEVLTAYMDDFPKLNGYEIDACMDIGVKNVPLTIKGDDDKDIAIKDEDGNVIEYETVSAQDRAIAFGSPVNILMAYDYYAKKDPSRLAELDEVAKAYLSAPENVNLPYEEAPDKAFALLALADKIKDKDAALYETTTTALAKSLKTYDTKKFDNLSDDELHKNYEELKTALTKLPSDSVAQIIGKYNFTDNNGKPLSGKKLEKAKADVLELARALTAQDLVSTGVPADKSLLLKRMDEVISTTILNKGISEDIANAAKTLTETQQAQYDAILKSTAAQLAQKDPKALEFASDAMARAILKTPEKPSEEELKKLAAQKQKIREIIEKGDKDTTDAAVQVLAAATGVIVRSEDENRKLLQQGDENATKDVATIMAYKEMGLPFGSKITDTKQQIKFNNLTDKNIQNLTAARNSQNTYSTGELAGRLAGTMQHAQTFEKRIKQHIGEKKLYGSVKAWLKKIDKNLTKHWGKPYVKTKKIIKPLVQFGWGFAKSAAIMTAVGAAGTLVGGPIGATAAITGYMAYMTGKATKDAVKVIRDPNATTAEKWSKGVGAAISGAFTIAGIGGAAGQMVGEHAPALLQCCSNLTSSLGGGTRLGMIATVQNIPNIAKAWNTRRKLKQSKAEISNTKDPAQLHKLITAHAALRQSQKSNLIDSCSKTLGTIGGGMLIQSDMVQELRAEAMSAVSHNETSAEHAATQQPNDLHGAKAPEPQASNMFDQHNPFSANYQANNIGFGLDGDGNTENQDFKPPYLNAEAQTAAEADMNPDDLHGAKAPENTLTDEQKAQNLAAAEEKGSGHIGKSDMESMMRDLNDKYGDKLGFTEEEKAAIAKSFGENYGTDSYEALHAAKAEPRILAAAMGITADVEASAQAAGIDTDHNYAKALINHMAAHPELANNEGFKAYVAEHFDDQDRFHSSNYTVHTETHHHSQAPQAAPDDTHGAKPETPLETKITYTVVDRLPGERPTDFQHEPVRVQPEPVIIEQPIPRHGGYDTGRLVYDPMLSEGLNHDQWRGAYIDPTRIIDGKPAVVYLPNDPLHDRPHITNMDDAVKAHDYAGGDTLGLYRDSSGVDINNPENNGWGRYSGYGYGTHVCYGNGTIVHTTVSSNDFGKQLGQYAAAHGVNIALNEAGHALHHLVDKLTR